MQTDWYIAVNKENDVLSSVTNAGGRPLLTWKSRIGNEPFPIILWPDQDLPKDVYWDWPEGTTMIHLAGVFTGDEL